MGEVSILVIKQMHREQLILQVFMGAMVSGSMHRLRLKVKKWYVLGLCSHGHKSQVLCLDHWGCELL